MVSGNKSREEKTGKDGKSCPNSAVRQEAKKEINSSSLHLLLCSGLTGLNDAQPLWEGQPTLLNPRIQILTSSRNTFTYTPPHKHAHINQ